MVNKQSLQWFANSYNCLEIVIVHRQSLPLSKIAIVCHNLTVHRQKYSIIKKTKLSEK